MGIKAMPKGLTMQLSAGFQTAAIGNTFKSEGEREAVREDGRVATHLNEGVKGGERG